MPCKVLPTIGMSSCPPIQMDHMRYTWKEIFSKPNMYLKGRISIGSLSLHQPQISCEIFFLHWHFKYSLKWWINPIEILMLVIISFSPTLYYAWDFLLDSELSSTETFSWRKKKRVSFKFNKPLQWVKYFLRCISLI